MSDTDNPIEKVRARLDGGRKWIKGSLGDCSQADAEVCIRGAIYAFLDATDQPSVNRISIERPIGATAYEQFPERFALGASGASIPAFNDHPDTTWADVELVLDKASIAWDEQVR